MTSERLYYAIAGNASHEQLLISHADPLPDGGLRCRPAFEPHIAPLAL